MHADGVVEQVWYLIVAVVFTYFVVSTSQPIESVVPREERRLTAQMDWVEVFVSVVFGGKLVTELLQFFIQGALLPMEQPYTLNHN